MIGFSRNENSVVVSWSISDVLVGLDVDLYDLEDSNDLDVISVVTSDVIIVFTVFVFLGSVVLLEYFCEVSVIEVDTRAVDSTEVVDGFQEGFTESILLLTKVCSVDRDDVEGPESEPGLCKVDCECFVLVVFIMLIQETAVASFD